MRCSSCDAPAVVDQPYRHAHLCEGHFLRSVDERVRTEFHHQLPRFSRGTVAVALSGGKDSAVALVAAHRYFGLRPTVRLVALSVDEGIEGYRPATLARATELTERLGVEHVVVRAADVLGTTTDRAAAALPAAVPCSFCGVWRRRILNAAARDAGAAVLVLGFNLDDLAQTTLMNLVRGDVDRVGRMAPHRVRQADLVPRIAPLAQVPEREVFLYAHLTRLPFDHGECPYAGRAARNVFRETVWNLEESIPGTRQALLRTQARIADLLLTETGVGAPGRCTSCGEPSTGARCRACEFLDSVRGASPVGALP